MLASNEVALLNAYKEANLKKIVRFGSHSLLIGCRSRRKPAFYKLINGGLAKTPPFGYKVPTAW